MGNITGLRLSSQARATCEGVARSFLATVVTTPPRLDRDPAFKGNQGMNPRLCLVQ